MFYIKQLNINFCPKNLLQKNTISTATTTAKKKNSLLHRLSIY